MYDAEAATVYENDHPVAKISLRTTGFEGQPITVRLKREADSTGANPPEKTPPAETVTRTLTPDGPSGMVEFDLDASQLGRQRYVVSTEVLPGETRVDNNSKKFALQVVDDQADVHGETECVPSRTRRGTWRAMRRALRSTARARRRSPP